MSSQAQPSPITPRFATDERNRSCMRAGAQGITYNWDRHGQQAPRSVETNKACHTSGDVWTNTRYRRIGALQECTTLIAGYYLHKATYIHTQYLQALLGSTL